MDEPPQVIDYAPDNRPIWLRLVDLGWQIARTIWFVCINRQLSHIERALVSFAWFTAVFLFVTGTWHLGGQFSRERILIAGWTGFSTFLLLPAWILGWRTRQRRTLEVGRIAAAMLLLVILPLVVIFHRVIEFQWLWFMYIVFAAATCAISFAAISLIQNLRLHSWKSAGISLVLLLATTGLSGLVRVSECPHARYLWVATVCVPISGKPCGNPQYGRPWWIQGDGW